MIVELSDETFDKVTYLKKLTLAEYRLELDELSYQRVAAHFNEDTVIRSAVEVVLESAKTHIKGECSCHGNVRRD